MRRSPFLFIVRYRRENWQWAQARIYLSERPARRLIGKLLGDAWEWEDLSPIVELKLTRRPLGEEELLQEWSPRSLRRWRR